MGTTDYDRAAALTDYLESRLADSVREDAMVSRRAVLGTTANLLGFLAGLVVMYATDLLVAL